MNKLPVFLVLLAFTLVMGRERTALADVAGRSPATTMRLEETLLIDASDGRLDHLTPLFIVRQRQANTALPPGEEFRISGRWIQKLVKRYALAAGIVSLPTPHSLRHSFATDLISHGADLRAVQELLGHEDIRTTQIYAHVTSPELKKVHERYHNSRQELQI